MSKKLISVYVFICIFLFSSCNDVNQSNSKKSIKSTGSLYPSAPSFSYDPLDRIGCDSNILEEEPVSDYLNAINSTPVDVEIARNSLVALNKQLRCMSSYDFALNYTSFMDYMDSAYSMNNGDTKLVPIMLVFIENGAKLIDNRAALWVFNAGYNLKNEIDNEIPIAGNIGLFFKQGLGLVRFSTLKEKKLSLSFSSASWIRAKCSLQSTIIFDDDNPQLICLNDSCPIFDNHLDPDIYDYSAYNSYCDQANQDFDNEKEVAGGFANGSNGAGGNGSSQGGSGDNGGFTNDDMIFDKIINCINDFNAANESSDYACAVQVANKNNPVIDDFQLESIGIGLDVNISPNECAPNPIGDDYTQQDEDANELKKKKDHYDKLDAQLVTADEALKKRNAAPVGSEERAYWEGVWLDALDASDVLDAASKLLELRDAHASAKSDYEDFSEIYDNRYNNDNPIFVCQNDGTGCDIGCNITDIMGRETAECLGVSLREPNVSRGELPGSNPEIVYPAPEDVDGDGAYAELSQCIADALGVNTGTDPLEEGESCGQLMLCTNNSTSVVNSDIKCSCGAAGADAFGFSYGWGNMYECEETILCSQDNTSCGCGGISPPQQIDVLNGFPVKPETFYRVPSYDDFE